MNRTIILWRRLGREHGEGQGFRVNPPDVVRRHLETGVTQKKKTPDGDWRWYQVNDDLLIERPVTAVGQRAETRIYYLPKRNWVILDRASFESLPGYTWYIHIGSTEYHEDLGAWVFTDHFADVIIKADGVTHSVMDLDDLALVTELGLIDPPLVTSILTSTQRLVDDIRRGKFPPGELVNRETINAELGWNI